MLESIKYFLCLLDLEPRWPVILIITIAMWAVFPKKKKGEAIQTKDEDGNIVITYYEDIL